MKHYDYLNDFVNIEKENFISVFKRYPICFVKGKGNYLWDHNGKKYTDFLSGISVCVLGHCNKQICKAVKKQLDNLLHVSNIFYNESQLKLAKKLNELFKLASKKNENSKVFFSNSGAEANEAAIKIARKFGNQDEKKRFEIITFNNSFHGRTLATLAATGQKKFHDGFEPLPEGFKYADFNNFESIKKVYSTKTIAIMLELIQGEGGVCIADKNFIKKIESFCKEKNLILIVDEIQTGIGRTGKMFAFEHYNISPDIITLAKAIGGGLPLGVTIIQNKLKNVLTYGNHGTTFGGNLVSCAAGFEMLNQLDNKKFKYIRKISLYFFEKLNELKQEYDFIKEIRGKGLMIGLELTIEIPNLVQNCLEKGLIINMPKPKVIRFLPPYSIQKKDIDFLIETLRIFFDKASSSLP
ncbi:MAG: aspartate aminotransferase family protein [Elusimicrobiota bacterium]|jgi:acetylornithine/N-succinyldiaminopimelate aminotransferase|nr:aspartate aminotransferase family protein [Elusimicrobiota bacterium]